MNRLSARERVLVGIVLGVVFILVNFFVVSALVDHFRKVSASIVTKRAELKSLKLMFTEREMWAKRDAWLTKTQPKLTNRDQARVVLLEEVKTEAKTHNVALENSAFGSIDQQPTYQTASITLETKSTWKDLIAFLSALQKPERFIVLESTNLQIDPNDSTKMRGRFKVAKWYAP